MGRIRPSIWDCSVELGGIDRWVITSRPRGKIGHWLESGLSRVPEERAMLSIHAALAEVDDGELSSLWRCLFPYASGAPLSRWELEDELVRMARDPIPRIIVLERLIERGWRGEAVPPKPPTPSLRTQTDHYIVVQALDARQNPVSGVLLELLIADGELRRVATDAQGVARAERIQAGRVVIRMPELDGNLWRPLEGAPSQLSSAPASPRWHALSRGESLSQLALRYGLESWRRLWEHARNASLRARRQRPNGLCPGDELAIPPNKVHEFIRETDATHRIEVLRSKPRRGWTLETHDLQFHLGSCVFLGDCRAAADLETSSSTSGIDALATALRFARDHADKRLLLAGHCDATGDPDLNQTLSEQRASALKHLLCGERDEWVRAASARFTIADYQQILSWFSLTYGWPCRPLAVDDREGPDNRRVLRGFQAAYNQHFGLAIAEDGRIGPETWGAIFDVYQEQLALALETDAAGLDGLRQRLTFCSAAESYGCASFFALHGTQGSAPAAFRRAEVLFFDAGDEPSADDLAQGPLLPPAFTFELLPAERGQPLVWFSLQTVDDLGFRLGNVALVFESGGVESAKTTDANGVWRGQLRADSSVDVRRADGGALRLGSSVDETTRVNLQASWATHGATDLVIVGSADAETLHAQREQLRRYAALPEVSARTARGVLAARDTLVGEAMQELPREEGQPRAFTRRFYHSGVADNLLLAAGLSIEQLPDVIDTWLGDYYPEIARRGFFVQIVHGGELRMLDASGAQLGRFHLSEGARISGRMGLYGLLESDRASSGAIFADLTGGRTSLAAGIVGPNTDDLSLRPENTCIEPAAVKPHDVFLRELIVESERETYLERWQEQIARGLVELVYYVPREGLATYARIGGTGLLEPYPADTALREHVHARNRATAKTAGVVYAEYIKQRITQIRAIDPDPEHATAAGKPHPEEQLRALGSIEGGPIFPRPIGADEAQHRDILEDAGDTTGYRAYKAWTGKYNQIFHARTSGSAWLACEVSLEPKLGAAKAKYKLNFEVNTDGHGAIHVKRSFNTPIELGPGQVEVEVDSEGVVKTKGKGGALGPFEIELSNRGVTKLTYHDVSVVYDANQQQLIGEVSFSLRDLVLKSTRHRWKQGEEPQWVKDLPDLKIKPQMGIQLSRGGEVEAVYGRYPGAMEKSARHDFHKRQWSTLDDIEKLALQSLGFDQESWDQKKMPESTRQPFSSLTDEQKHLAAKHLPVPTGAQWESYWSGVEADSHRDVR